MTNQDEIIKQRFKQHIQEITLKHILLISSLGVLALFYYMYSDMFIRNNMQAFYMRLLPFIIGVPLFIFHLFTKEKYKSVKVIIYNIFLASATVMMYGICLIHLHDNALAPSVTGAILVIFIISLEVKTNTTNTILVYFLPLLAFTLSLVFYFKPSSEEFTVMADIYPIIIAGFAINRIQYNLRYKAFKSGMLLDLEKQKTEELYKKTLIINDDLQKKNDEIIAHKEEIEEKNQKLRESNATKDKFLTIISHDLMGSFNILMGFSDLLVENFYNDEDKEAQKSSVDYIHQNVHTTYKLLENLLIWAKSQKDALGFNLEKNNLFLLTNEIVELLKQSAETKSINIINTIDKEIIVDADKNMLATILRNLISNAIKFTLKDGTINLKATIEVENSNKQFVKISVQDNGLGISPEIKDKLFSVSSNVSTRGTERERGTGLGLILCREFVEKHGGKIYVESELDIGSNFIFTLPYVE